MAVQQNGRALEHAAEDLKANREAVLTAAQQDGHALRYAAKSLMADREVVLAAVRHDMVRDIILLGTTPPSN